MNALVRTSARNSVSAIVRMRLITPPPRPTRRSSSVGLAMRTKMSCSEGFVTSNCSTVVRCISSRRNACGSPVQPHVLVVAVVVDRFDARQARERRRAAAESHADRVVAVLLLDRVERAVEHLPALEDHEDARRTASPRRPCRAWRRRPWCPAAAARAPRRAAPRRSRDRARRTARRGSAASGCDTTAAMNWTFCAMPLESGSIRLSAHGAMFEPLEPARDDGIELLAPGVPSAGRSTEAAGAPASACTARAPPAGTRRVVARRIRAAAAEHARSRRCRAG